MRKLYHQNSCHVTLQQSSNLNDKQSEKLLQTDLPVTQNQNQIKMLEGKILLLEERGKNIQQFYQNKISQLKMVLLKQNQTKNQLMQDLQKLANESQKQNKYVNQLKNKLQDERLNASLRLAKQVQPNLKADPSIEKYSVRKNSKAKAGLLFNSNNIRQTSKNKFTLKKSKSQQYLQSQYFMSQTQARSGTIIQNPQKTRIKLLQ